MHAVPLKNFLALFLLVGVNHAGLVNREAEKETLIPTTPLPIDKDIKSSSLPQRLDHIPVTIIRELETASGSETPVLASVSPNAVTLPELTEEQPESSTLKQTKKAEIDSSGKNDGAKEEQLDEELNKPSETLLNVAQKISDTNEEQSSTLDSDVATSSAPLVTENKVKKITSTAKNDSLSQQASEIVDSEVDSSGNSVPVQDDFKRQVTQATPTQTSTQQNFVQQFIQNSPIGQFLSQLTGQQQQQQQQPQQGQVQADEIATPAPTIPGFLNPAAAITSAQQVVQNAAQSVVNTTTQAFQGLQQFASNLGSQFQNTFSTLAGQQNQLTTADSTTVRPPGPIQSIVSSFVNSGNTQGVQEGAAATAAPGQQQPARPLQGILSFFQGNNRPLAAQAPQATQAQAATTASPPKDEPVTPAVDDKIEQEQQEETLPVKEQQPEPDAANEVRNSGEVTNEDTSFEDVQGEDIIEVNDDSTQQDITV